MSATATSRRLGREAEVAFLEHARTELGFPAERLRLNGRDDEGDVWVDAGGGIAFVVEVKNVAKIDLAGFVGEAAVEAENFARSRGRLATDTFPLVVIKRRGTRDVGKWYVVTTVDDFPW